MKYLKFIIPIAVVIFLYGVYRYFFPTEEEKNKAINEFLGAGAFSQNYDNVTTATPVLSNAQIEVIGNEMNDVHGYFNDDEDKMFVCLRKISTIVDSCRVARYMVGMNFLSPKDIISTYFSNDEIYRCQQIIKTYK